MRRRPPDYIVWQRQRRRSWGGWLVGLVGVLGFATGLAVGLNLIVALVMGVAVAGLVAAVRNRM